MVATAGPEDWKRLLADPEKHWRRGYSAMATAYSWEEAEGVPGEIGAMFAQAEDTRLRDAELALAIPEYKVELAGGTRASQNDVFVLLTSSGGLITMTVEGKAREDFGSTVGDWKEGTSAEGARARLQHIKESIGLAGEVPDEVRYQLLHRTASAVIEARRFQAKYAVMLVQSFVEEDAENHYGDFCKFVELFGRRAEKGVLIELGQVDPGRLLAGWVQSKER